VVELAEPLTPALREVARTEQRDGSQNVTYVLADDDVQPDTVTVHGMLRNGPRRMTLIDASTAGRQQVLGGSVGDPGMERLQADYAVLGGHIAGRGVRFTHARVQLQHLDVWAQLPGIEMQVATDGSRAILTHDQPNAESVQLRDPAGQLVLDSTLTLPEPTVRGGSLRRTAELRWDSSDAGLTIDELWVRLVDPLRVLLTLAVDADSPAVSLEVRANGDEPWLQVAHPGLAPVADELLPAHKVLLTRRHLGLPALERWLFRAGELSPVPQLVAAVAMSPAQRTVENQLLELAAAAEGLHRRLHPKQRILSRNQARDARRDAYYAVLEEVRDRVKQALGHLDEPTYRDRLEVLVEQGLQAAPGVTGEANEWIGLIVPARNGFAHQLAARKNREVEIEEYLVLHAFPALVTHEPSPGRGWNCVPYARRPSGAAPAVPALPPAGQAVVACCLPARGARAGRAAPDPVVSRSLRRVERPSAGAA